MWLARRQCKFVRKSPHVTKKTSDFFFFFETKPETSTQPKPSVFEAFWILILYDSIYVHIRIYSHEDWFSWSMTAVYWVSNRMVGCFDLMVISKIFFPVNVEVSKEHSVSKYKIHYLIFATSISKVDDKTRSIKEERGHKAQDKP